MSAYIVSYDLIKQGQNYDCITDKLETYPNHWHMQQSVWIVVTDQTHSQIRDNLKSCLDQNDKLFVGKLSAAAWHPPFGEKGDKWLIENIR